MSSKTFDFAIIGGDTRQLYMALGLTLKGYSVILYGITASNMNFTYSYANSLADAINSSTTIILPIPFTKDKKTILSNKKEQDLNIEHLCLLLSKEHKLYGGCLTNEIKECCDNIGAFYMDFMDQEEITLFNTIATAEGTIAEAIINSTINLHQSPTLILGFGRCARTLAEKLKSLSGSVTIAARSKLALSEANASSFEVVPLNKLEDHISDYQFIFNTIPALVLTENLLKASRKDVVIIDIASAPGGTDFSSAEKLGRKAKLCLGLPGKYAPEASADFLTSYLLTSLGKK